MQRDHRIRGLLEVAEAFTRSGRLGPAIRSYQHVLTLARQGEFERELAHARLADLHLGMGDPHHAVPHLREALALSNGEPEYALMLGRALLALGRPEEAQAPLLEAAARPAYTTESLAVLARCLQQLGDRATAAHLARIVAERAPQDPDARRLARDLADA